MRTALALAASLAVFVGVLYGGGNALGVWDEFESPWTAPGTRAEGGTPTDWKVHRAAGFSIALPDTWKAVGSKEKWDTAALARSNPRLARFFRTTVSRRIPYMKLIAFDTGPRARRIAQRNLFATNLNVIQARISIPRADLWRREVAALRSLPGRVGPVRRWHADIDGRSALKLRSHIAARSLDKRRLVISITQWSVVAGGYEYVITFTTTKQNERAYAKTFETSAQSLTLLEAPAEPAPDSNAFADRANDICAAHVVPATGKNITAAQRARRAANVVAAQILELKRLQPPRAQAARYHAMLAAADRLLAAMRRYADAAARKDGNAAGRAMQDVAREGRVASRHARAIGLTVCAG